MLDRRPGICIGFVLLLGVGGTATGCPGDDVTVDDETGGPTTTGADTSASASATTMSSSSTSASTSTGPDDSSSSGPDTDTDSTTTIEPDSSTTEDPSTTTIEPTESSGSTADESSSSSSSSSSGGEPEQDCPYGDLAVPDSISTSTADEDSEFSSSCGGNGAPDVSYLLTAPEDGVYVIDTVGSSIDTILAVYDGECGGDLIACNNDDPDASPASRVSVELVAGQTVTVVADGFAVAGGAVTINVAFYEGICPNGDLGNAVPVTLSGSTMASDNTLFGSCGGGTASDETFTFVAPAPGIYTFDTSGSDFDTVLYLRDECLGTELGCNDNGPVDETSSVTITLAQDDEVVVVVDGAGLESGNYDVNVELDSCPDADIGSTVPQALAGSTVGGIDQAAGSCGTNNGSPDVAYTFTAPNTGTFVFDTEGSAFDTRLYVYDGAVCVGTELDCDDDGGSGTTSLLVLDLVQDQLITVIVDGYNGQEGAYNLNITSPVCGNGSLDAFEACDGVDLGGETCVTQGFGGGVLACDENCAFDLSDCDSCGDNLVNGADTCDGYAIAATKCEDLGFAGGSNDCDPTCDLFDTSECSNDVIAVCSQPGAAIDSAFPTTLDTIDVPDMGAIADVDLFLDITHTYTGDLDISLDADDLGLSNNIVQDACGTSANAFVYFNDEGNGPATTSCLEPFGLEGNATPMSAMSVYDGAEANGSWTLTITDDAGGDIGTLNEWCLYFTLEP